MKPALTLFLLFFIASRAHSQNAVDPPSRMRLCSHTKEGKDILCENLIWARDHYDGFKDGQSVPSDKYRIKEWEGGYFKLRATSKADDGTEQSMDCMGWIDDSGDHANSGDFDYGANGEMHFNAFRLSWDRSSSSRSIAAFVAAQPRPEAPKTPKFVPAPDAGGFNVNGIHIPPGASKIFATFPDDVRALLLPEHPLLESDAVRPCDDSKEDDPANTGETDPVVSLEIGRYALRRGEFLRGRCWVNHSAVISHEANSRAMTIIGILHLMGWTLPQDYKKAYHEFINVGYQTHDVYALYFAEQCLLTGNGTDKDLSRAGGIEVFLMTHEEGRAMYMKIGADDENVIARANALREAMTPHTHTETQCYQSAPPSTVPGAPSPRVCHPVEVPDR